MKIIRKKLANGLKVVMSPMKETQAVQIEIMVRAGSKYETKSSNGLSHFLEHMMFKGTKKRPSSKVIAEELDGVGSEYNAYTGKEATGYWVKVPKKHFSLALDVVSDLYLNSLFKKEDIEKERGVILQEMAMYQDIPQQFVWDIFEELLYGNQPAGWKIIGTEKNIQQITQQDFINYKKNFYTAPSTVVVISGNFSPEKAFQEVKHIFGKMERKQAPQKKKVIEKQNFPGLKIFAKETDQTHLILGFRAFDMFSPKRYIASVLASVLGGGMSSRLFLSIREKYGLAYYVGAGTEKYTDSGFFCAYAGVEHSKLEKTLNIILDEINRLKKEKISVKELTKVKESLRGKVLMDFESTEEISSFLGTQELLKGKATDQMEILKQIDRVTASQLQNIANEIFLPNKMNLALIGPHQNRKTIFKKILTSNLK